MFALLNLKTMVNYGNSALQHNFCKIWNFMVIALPLYGQLAGHFYFNIDFSYLLQRSYILFRFFLLAD